MGAHYAPDNVRPVVVVASSKRTRAGSSKGECKAKAKAKSKAKSTHKAKRARLNHAVAAEEAAGEDGQMPSEVDGGDGAEVVWLQRMVDADLAAALGEDPAADLGAAPEPDAAIGEEGLDRVPAAAPELDAGAGAYVLGCSKCRYVSTGCSVCRRYHQQGKPVGEARRALPRRGKGGGRGGGAAPLDRLLLAGAPPQPKASARGRGGGARGRGGKGRRKGR